MKRHRRTVLTSVVTMALAGLLAPAADAGSPILSGYGEPGAGEQEILGSQLLNGRSGGGPTGPSDGAGAAQPATSSTGESQGVAAQAPAVNDAPGQESAAAAVAMCVLAKAITARPLACRAEPALNPNQPTHRSDAPIKVSVRLCGGIGSRP